MSERDTMFNEGDRSCTAVQLIPSTDPSYDNRTIARTLKMQTKTVQWQQYHCKHPHWIAMNNRDVPRVMKTKFLAMVMVWFQVRATSCHLTSLKSAWKSIPKCTWMCWRVWWSPGAIRWPAADPGCDSRTRHQLTSPKSPGLGLRRSATTLYSSLTGSPPPPTRTTSFGQMFEIITNMTSHNTKASLITAIRQVFAELLPALVEKACSQFRIRIEAVIEAEGGYIE